MNKILNYIYLTLHFISALTLLSLVRLLGQLPDNHMIPTLPLSMYLESGLSAMILC